MSVFSSYLEKIAEEESKSKLPILRHGGKIGGSIALPLAGIYGGGRLAEHLATTHGGKITNETLRKALPHAKNIGRGVGGVAGLAAAYGLNKALEKKSAYEQGYYDAIEKIADGVEEATKEVAEAAPGMFEKMKGHLKGHYDKARQYVGNKASETWNYAKANPVKAGGLTAAGVLGSYGAKKLYDRFTGDEKLAAYEQGYYDAIEKIAQQQDRESNRGKIIGGAGIAGLGGYLNHQGNKWVNNIDDLAEEIQRQSPVLNKEEAKDIIEKASRVTKKVGKGAMGLGGLLAGYGAFKNYHSNKN